MDGDRSREKFSKFFFTSVNCGICGCACCWIETEMISYADIWLATGRHVQSVFLASWKHRFARKDEAVLNEERACDTVAPFLVRLNHSHYAYIMGWILLQANLKRRNSDLFPTKPLQTARKPFNFSMSISKSVAGFVSHRFRRMLSIGCWRKWDFCPAMARPGFFAANHSHLRSLNSP